MAKWNKQSTHVDLAAFSDNPEVRQQVRRRRIIIATAIVLACAIVAISAKPTYRAVRKIQIDRNLDAAQAAARLEDWGTARNKARSVLIARPGDFEAYRIWFKALANMNEPRTYMVAANLFTHPSASDADRLEALGVLARSGPEAVALSAYASMEESMREDPIALAALSPLLVRRGEVRHVEATLRAALESTRIPQVRLELLRALCSIPTQERVAEARTIFADLIADDTASAAALEALIILGETPGGLATGPPLPPLAEWVRLQPSANTLHHLLALHPAIDAAGGPAQADRIFQSAISRFIDVDPGTIGSWLIRHDQANLAAELLATPAESSPSAYIARIHALLRDQRPAEVTTLLANPPDASDLVEIALAKAAAARMMNQPANEANAWLQALNNAVFDQTQNRFLEIAQFATTLEAHQVSEDAWVAAIRVGWGPIPLYRDLQNIYLSLASKSRSEDLLAMSRTLLRFEPQNPDLINNFYYLALLHQVVAPDDATQALSALVESHPDRPEFRSALALAHLSANQPEQALEQLTLLTDSSRVSPLMLRALEGTAHIMTGDTTAGTNLLQGINWRLFMRAESLTFRRLLNRINQQNLPIPPMTQIEPAPAIEDAPAWRRAVERLEKDRAQDVLPTLPPPTIPGTENAD